MSRPPRTSERTAHVVVLGAVLALALIGAPRASAHATLEQDLARADSLLVRTPDDLSLRLWRADLERLSGHWNEAEASLNAAGHDHPGEPRVAIARAALALDRGDAPAALAWLDHILARDPNLRAARLLRATARERAGDPAGAIEDLGRAIALEPRPQPEHVLARAQLLEREGRDDQALQALDQATAVLGAVATIEQEAIEIEMRLGRVDAALVRLDRLAPQYQRPEQLTLERGDLLERAGRRPEALATWSEGLEALRQRRGGRDDAALVAAFERRLERETGSR
jgi:tetratricopeptide (TPR) repeat protein